MTGVPRELAEHALEIIPGSKPVRQEMRCFGDEKCHAIAKEISKLQRSDPYKVGGKSRVSS
jgi:hypothetical protein